jgi:hypothetical protein
MYGRVDNQNATSGNCGLGIFCLQLGSVTFVENIPMLKPVLSALASIHFLTPRLVYPVPEGKHEKCSGTNAQPVILNSVLQYLYGMTLLLLCPVIVSAKVDFAPVAGLSFSNVKWHVPHVPQKTDKITNPKFGFLLDWRMTPSIYFQPGVSYSGAGYGFKAGNQKVTLQTIEIPSNFEFKTGQPGSGRAIFGAGVFAAYSFRSAISSYNPGKKVEMLMVNNLYFGGTVNAGYELAMGVFARVSYQTYFSGFSSLSAINEKGLHQWSITAAYLINKHKEKRQAELDREIELKHAADN